MMYEALRFMIQSHEDKKVTYIVDLVSHKGNGKCDCPHFRCRLEPRIRDRKKGPHRCKHIEEAMMELADDTIQRFIKIYGKNSED